MEATAAAPRKTISAWRRPNCAVVPVLNGLLTAALFTEAKWIARRRTLPFGTSLIAIARKPPAQAHDRDPAPPVRPAADRPAPTETGHVA